MIKSLRESVYLANLELVKRGLVIYTWGNVSALDNERGLVIIKPRGIEYEKMSADDMVTVDLEGNVAEGKLLPSVDLDIHLELYKSFKAVRAIAHTHSFWATVWAQSLREIPVLGTTHADHFYGAIPCTRPLRPQEIQGEYEKETGKVIVETLKSKDPKTMRGVLVGNHGPFTWGDAPEEAVEYSVILEEVAKMALMTYELNPKIKPISQLLLDKHYLRKYGPDSYFYQNK